VAADHTSTASRRPARLRNHSAGSAIARHLRSRSLKRQADIRAQSATPLPALRCPGCAWPP
jgi:hypothetical protein